MGRDSNSQFLKAVLRAGYLVLVILLVMFVFPIYLAGNLWYTESKGPFKNWTQVVDLDGNGELDVLVSHVRWEQRDLSWAGVGRWMNQGQGRFTQGHTPGADNFGGYAAAAGDIDLDGDADVFVQDFPIRLIVNQGADQADTLGMFISLGGIKTPPDYGQGYRDMGGTITLGDLNGDSLPDAFIGGCCYGLNPREPGYDFPSAPSVSWFWINAGRENHFLTGDIFPLEDLNGRPIRQAAMGDIDGDGDLDIYAAVGEPTMGSTITLNDVILLNDGRGKLSIYELPAADTDSTSVALGDVNGDGHLDALVGTSRGAKLWINQGLLPGREAPVFSATGESFAPEQTRSEKVQGWVSAAAGRVLGLYLANGSPRTQSVFLQDLDGDGDLDAVIARLFEAEIWWNDGRGQFQRSQARFSYPEDTGVAVADFDADGDADIFTVNNGKYQLRWNNSQGKFTTARRQPEP